MLSFPELSHEEITKAVDDILKNYYFSVNYIPLVFRQILRRHGLDELKRILYSAKVFLGYMSSR